MKRFKLRQEVLNYLREFFTTIILYKEFPVKQKICVETWAMDMYEQLSDEQRLEIYNKRKVNNV